MKICRTHHSPVGVVRRQDVSHIDHLLERRRISCNDFSETISEPRPRRRPSGIYGIIAAAGLLTTFAAWAAMSG